MKNIFESVLKLDPVTQLELKDYLVDNIVEILKLKDSNSKIIKSYKEENLICEKCNCKLYRNGKTKNGIQKYICSNCKKTTSITTGTIIYNSKINFDIWKKIIDNLLDGFSIRRIAQENKISIKTSFFMRHKILIALDDYFNNLKLSGEVQADEKFFTINLKGTKRNMPRFSKKRTSSSNSLKGISHHKICVVSAIDSNDNLFFNIAGLGKVSIEMVNNSFDDKFINVSKIVTDSASGYMEYCFKNNINHCRIQSGFHAVGMNNLAEINGCHSQLSTWLAKFRGVSIRHLQKYLNWFAFLFTMQKRYLLKNLKLKCYKTFITNDNYMKTKTILNLKMPIDLNIAYSEYINQS